MVRYADDLVICCQNNRDAERIKATLAQRLAKYGLKMNEDKTETCEILEATTTPGNETGDVRLSGIYILYRKISQGISPRKNEDHWKTI